MPTLPYSNAPSYSCRLWQDRGFVYVELASGLIQKFDRTEGALSKVLKLLEIESRSQSPRTIGRSKASLPKPARRSRRKRPAADPDQLDLASKFLKKTGAI